MVLLGFRLMDLMLFFVYLYLGTLGGLVGWLAFIFTFLKWHGEE